jgi:Pyruvate/2-oxoacid:ferredoxin oxidoreductase delta subunit
MGTSSKDIVATYNEIEALIRSRDVIYLNHCFCRGPAKEGKAAYEYCGHPTETCMGLSKPKEDSKYTYRKISQKEALEKFEQWKTIGRLFRFMEDKSWICLCCSCGCGWFRDKDGNRVKDPCDKSPLIQYTDEELCIACEECIPCCPYEARKIDDNKLIVENDNCYGCSACEPVCPNEAISMISRTVK